MRYTTILSILLFAGCCCARGPAPGSRGYAAAAAPSPYEPPAGTATPDSATQVEMQNVKFRVDERLALNIQHLRGTMHPHEEARVVDFGDPGSFYIEVDYGEVGLAAADLGYLLNRYVFNYDGAPLTIHSISIEDGRMQQAGVLHKVVDIPFEMTAEVSATDDGRIRLHPISMLICDIPGKGLMSALGIQLEELLDLSAASGVEAQENDLLLDPSMLLPPPEFRAEVASVRIEDDELVQVLGSQEAIQNMPSPSYPNAENYMYFSGGTLHFGKLYMVRADLQIIDKDPSDPFDFFLKEYMQQLVASRSETMPDEGLATYFPDFADMDSAASR